MDFIDWCTKVLTRLLAIYEAKPDTASMGVYIDWLAQDLFDRSFLNVDGTPEGTALVHAVIELEKAGFIQPRSNLPQWFNITRRGEDFLRDPIAVWEQICAIELSADERLVLTSINRQSEQSSAQFADVHAVDSTALLSDLGWGDVQRVSRLATKLVQQLGLLRRDPFSGDGFTASYQGLVWSNRRGFTLESKRIDGLVQEWETTSIDFKRELSLDTVDQKAEFIKDMLGLVNTQASGRRLFIIGFDPKTHAYYGPPNPKLKQDIMEQILARGTTPVVDIRYEVIDYRQGAIGQIEVVRDAKKLPYKVAVSQGSKEKGGKRIEQGQIFVRHGSQTEQPTDAELQALMEESERARQAGP